MDWGKRATDQGKEDPYIMLARVDERLKALDKTMIDYIHANKGNFQTMNSRVDSSLYELEKKINRVSDTVNLVRDRVFIGVGAISCIVIVIGWVVSIKH